jgi:hypothetical protein
MSLLCASKTCTGRREVARGLGQNIPRAQNRKVYQKSHSSKYLSAFLQAIRHQSRHPG